MIPFSYLRDRVCPVFSGAEKFWLAHGLGQLTCGFKVISHTLNRRLLCNVKCPKKKNTNNNIGVGRGGARGARPPNNLRGGANIPFGPPNNPPTFSFNFYVKQEKITNEPS